MAKAVPQGKWGMFKDKIKLIDNDEVPFVLSIKKQREAIKRNQEAKKNGL